MRDENTSVTEETLALHSFLIVEAQNRQKGPDVSLALLSARIVLSIHFFLRDLTGTVRDVCCSPDGRWIAFGFSTGLASVLDIRGGLLRSQRRAHTGDILQV